MTGIRIVDERRMTQSNSPTNACKGLRPLKLPVDKIMPQMKKNPVVAPGFADNFALNMDSSKGLGPWTAGDHQLPLLQTRLWVWSNGVLDRSCWKAKDSFIRRNWVGRNSSSIHSVYCISSSFRPESEFGRQRCLFLLSSSAAVAAAAAAANNSYSSSSIILLCDMILSIFNEEVKMIDCWWWRWEVVKRNRGLESMKKTI